MRSSAAAVLCAAFLALLHMTAAFPLERVYLGSLGFQFKAPETEILGRADLDNDGIQDMIVKMTTSTGFAVAAWFGRRDNKFQDSDIVLLLSTDGVLKAAVLDMNNDGLPEILLARPNQPLAFFSNQGNRMFSSPTALGGSPSEVDLVFTCDVNNDGSDDVVMISPNEVTGYADSTTSFNTYTPIINVNSISPFASRCHRHSNGTNYLVACGRFGQECSLFDVATSTAYPLLVNTNPDGRNMYIDPFTNIAYAASSTGLVSISYRGENNVTVDTQTIPQIKVLQGFSLLSVYNSDGDMFFVGDGSAGYYVGALSGDFTQLEIFGETTQYLEFLSSTYVNNEPEMVYFTRSPSNREVLDFYMFGPMLRPFIEPSWTYLTAAAPFTIVGRNLSEALSVRVLWRVTEGDCDISALNTTENGCPSMTRSGDSITCSIPLITANCTVQARVVANYTGARVNRMSAWENQLVFGSAQLRIVEPRTQPGRNGTRVTFRSPFVPNSFDQYPYEIALATTDAEVCVGSVWHDCSNSYLVEAEGFSCAVYHNIEWVSGQEFKRCPVSATLQSNQEPLFLASEVVGLTKIQQLIVTIDNYDSSQVIPSTQSLRLSFPVEAVLANPAPSDFVSTWSIVVQEAPDAFPLRMKYLGNNGDGIAIECMVVNGFEPSFKLITKNGAYESDFTYAFRTTSPFTVYHVRIVPDEDVEVITTLNLKLFLSADWRSLTFQTAIMNITINQDNRVPTPKHTLCPNITAQLLNNPLENGLIPVICRVPYFSADSALDISVEVNGTAYRVLTGNKIPGLLYHPDRLAVVATFMEYRFSDYSEFSLRYYEPALVRPALMDYGYKCPAFSNSPIQVLLAPNRECFFWNPQPGVFSLSINEFCLTPAQNRTTLNGCLIYIRPRTQPVAPWRELLIIATGQAQIESQETNNLIVDQGTSSFLVSATGTQLPLFGEEPYVELKVRFFYTDYICGSDGNSSVILSQDGTYIACNLTYFPLTRDSVILLFEVRRFGEVSISSQIGFIRVYPVIDYVTPSTVSAFRIPQIGNTLNFRVFGQPFKVNGQYSETTNGLLMSVFLDGPNCRNSTVSSPIAYDQAISLETDFFTSENPRYLFPNVPIAFINNLTNVDGCILFMNYSDVSFFKFVFPLALIVEGPIQIDEKPLDTLVSINGAINITGSFLPRMTEPVYREFSSNTSEFCRGLVQAGNFTIASDFNAVGEVKKLQLQLIQFVPETDGCNLLIYVARGDMATDYTFVGNLASPAQINDTAAVTIVATASTQTISITGAYLPIESESAQVQIELEDGLSPCRNKVPPATTITGLSRAQLNFTFPYDTSYDSCVVYATVSRLGFTSARTRVATFVSVPTLNSQTPSVALNSTGAQITVSGSNLPRSAAEKAFVYLTSTCQADLTALGVNASVVSYSNDGTNVGISFYLPPGAESQLDGCVISASVSRMNETTSSVATQVSRLLVPPQPTQSNVLLVASSQSQLFSISGAFLPLENETPSVQLQLANGISSCRNANAPTVIFEAFSRQQLNFTINYDDSYDSCVFSVVVSRYGVPSTSTLLGSIISVPSIPNQLVLIRLNSSRVEVRITGSRLPRSAAENATLIVSTNCSVDLSSVGVTGSVVSYNDGNSMDVAVDVPAGVVQQLDNCVLFASVSRFNGSATSSVSDIGRFVVPPQLSSGAQPSGATLFVSGASFSVVFNGQYMPIVGDEFSATVEAVCAPQTVGGSPSVTIVTATSASIVQAGRNISAVFSALATELDGCALVGTVSRLGMTSTGGVSLGTVISRPVVTAGSTQLTAERAATLTISGQYMPRQGESFSVNLTTSCSAYATITCGSPSVVVNGSSVSCSVVAPPAAGCVVSARVTRQGFTSVAAAAVAQTVAPVFPPTFASLTLVIRLTGSTPPPAALVDQICAVIGGSFNPPLIPGINITCVSQVSKRAIAATYNVLASVVGESAITAAQTQTASPSFLESVTNSVSSTVSNAGYTVEPVSVAAPAPVASPVTSPVSTPSPNSVAPVPSGAAAGPQAGGSVASDGALTGGAIAGIVVAAVLAVGIVIVILVFVLRRKNNTSTSSPSNQNSNSVAMKAQQPQDSSSSADDQSSAEESSEESDEASEESSDEGSSEQDSEEASSSEADEDSDEASSSEQSSGENAESDEDSSEEASQSDESSEEASGDASSSNESSQSDESSSEEESS